jgi:23S rRNA pseudouridine2605 synthase
MSNKPFDKFIHKAESGAKKKERIRQEKKKIRAEKNAWFEEQKKLAREKRENAKGTGSRFQGAGSKGQGAGLREEEGKRKNIGKNKTPQSRAAGEQKAGSRQQLANSDQRSTGKSQTHRPPVIVRKRMSHSDGDGKASNLKPLPQSAGTNSEMPLNKFIAWSGVCGRREAAGLIKAGKVTVNNQLVTEPPFRVSQSDSIKVNGRKISIQKNLVYILLNKPKDYITTTEDPEGRKTVMDLVKQATTERVFPVGRLDRNTTGVLLLTNDGELAQRLTHPKYEVKKIYEVRLDKPVTKQQLDKIADGITLEDGFIQPDAVAYADAKDKSVVGIEIHSGRNRIVRRIFEHLGFKVKNLDRVMYGIFTKKNVDRGKWRLLTEKEIRLLKHLNTSFGNKKSS